MSPLTHYYRRISSCNPPVSVSGQLWSYPDHHDDSHSCPCTGKVHTIHYYLAFDFHHHDDSHSCPCTGKVHTIHYYLAFDFHFAGEQQFPMKKKRCAKIAKQLASKVRIALKEKAMLICRHLHIIADLLSKPR